VRDDILEGSWSPPVSDGSGRDRTLARRALEELESAGYKLSQGVLRDARGQPLAFEILVKTRQEERLALAYSRSLAAIGVEASVRLVDEVQYQRRRGKFDFDMTIGSWIASPSPGAEQRGRWGSYAAGVEGSYNLSGAASPAIDAMISALLAAREREDFVAAARALDRVLLSGFYIVPLFYAGDQWVAYSTRLGRPERTPLFGVDIDAWWSRTP
jgi:peptide/nickel transport system substrate-binding protein